MWISIPSILPFGFSFGLYVNINGLLAYSDCTEGVVAGKGT